ncbi:alpha/beta fold hydrolase [Halioxenophilus sp. WMMB6]|uniref:alpha/beta fold hydrolase n=1 Tax=Halioxenophilus sp. WMMB6 TaxID=3073815 RepID=UPI00295EC0EC|nr:alpha/beta fold hydrolase [Halioxenophilus sp. WMMB6]
MKQVPATTNPYGLITDSQYLTSQAAIEALWQQAEMGDFNACDGAQLHYRRWPNPVSDDAIVIVTGRAESVVKYREVIYNFYQQGFSIYSYDHRGQGFSKRLHDDPHLGHVERFADYVADLKHFYKGFVAPRQHRHTFMLAHSMGGAVATLYLEQYPTDFTAAALSAPLHWPDLGRFGTWGEILVELIDLGARLLRRPANYALTQSPFQPQRFREGDPTTLTHSRERFEETQRLFQEHRQIQLGGVSNRWLAETCRACRRLRRNAHHIAVPILVLQAEVDCAVTAQGQNRFCQALTKAGTNLCHHGKPMVIEGAYHELLMETDRYRLPVLNAILDFFNEQKTN